MGVILILTSYFINQNKTVDIHVHDTYYVIAQSHMFWFFAFLAWIIWLLYVLTCKLLYSNSLTWIHVIISFLSLHLFLFFLYFGRNISGIPRSYIDLSSWNKYYLLNNPDFGFAAFCTIAFCLAQITYLVNLALGLYKRFRN